MPTHQPQPIASTLLSGTCATAIACMALADTAFAGTPESASTAIEEVVVTGSRISRDPLDESTPLATLQTDDLARTGHTNLGAILQQMPVAGSAINTRFNVPGNFGFPRDGAGIGAGAAQMSLRNLGAKRTLVLVDGQRWIAGASASGVPTAVDLNSLPASVVERIEVLQDGASAIYGSDAIGGVVNVITRQSFDGFRASAQVGNYVSHGDGAATQLAALWGGGDLTRFVVGAQWVDEGEIFTSARKLSRFPNPLGRGCLDGGCSSFTPQGRFVLGPALGSADVTLNDGVVNDGGARLPRFDPAQPTAGDFHAFTAADRFNYNGEKFNYLLTPNQRHSLFARVGRDFSDAVRFQATAAYTRRESATRGAPEPLCLGNACGNDILNNIVIDAEQRYNPFGVDLSVADGTLVFFGRRPLESGPRIFEQTVDTRFLTARLDGQITLRGRPVNWDVNVSRGENRGSQRKRGAHNAARLATALGDPAVCRATPGCVPFNFFGGQGADGQGSITPEMLDYVGFVQRDHSEQTLSHVSLNATGALAELPAGTLDFAAGLLHRRQDGWFRPDPIAERGETAGIPAGATRGDLDVTEYYVELAAPIAVAARVAERLELNLAARRSDYGRFQPENTWRIGGLWRPTAGLSVRATVSTGLRAPGIGELFGGAAREDFAHLDPCADTGGAIGSANGGRDTPQPQHIRANCLALGAPPDLAQRNSQLTAVSSGSALLTPETSRSQLLGLVLRPGRLQGSRWVEALTLSADYYRIEVDDAIQGRSPAALVDACVETLDPRYCNAVLRSSSGNVERVDNPLTNIGGIETSGFDLAIDYRSPESRAGQFRLRLNATRLRKHSEWTRNADGSRTSVQHAGGLTNETFQRAFPRWRSMARLDWQRGVWGAGVTLRHISNLREPSGAKLDSRLYTDVRVHHTGLWKGRLVTTLGINNLLDEDPPVCTACGLVSMSAVAHDLPGVVGYFRVGLEFGER